MNESGRGRPFGSATARQRLRDATHEYHVRLNRHPLLEGITRRGYPLDFYRRVLVAYCHFYSGLETAIEQSLTALGGEFDYGSRLRLPWLVQDLEVLGVDPWSPANQPEVSLDPIVLDSVPKLVGVLYTVEGSSLGGQVISRHLAGSWNMTDASGARFFWGYGEQTEKYWRQFESYLERQLTDEDKTATAAEMARETFKLMEKVLDGYRYKHVV